MDPETRERLIQEHQVALRQLESEPPADTPAWPPEGFYLMWHLMVGITLGGIAAVVSLGANLVGAALSGLQPMQLIRVYLTFPMGEQALQVDDGLVLGVGCFLYLGTGALFGILIHLLLRPHREDRKKTLMIATGLGLGLWIVNFYLVLSWLQPMLLGGNWIVTMIPAWVGALTHLAFAWTIALGETWGRFERTRYV